MNCSDEGGLFTGYETDLSFCVFFLFWGWWWCYWGSKLGFVHTMKVISHRAKSVVRPSVLPSFLPFYLFLEKKQSIFIIHTNPSFPSLPSLVLFLFYLFV